jgi:nucleoside-diphosphate-sugar epimerase
VGSRILTRAAFRTVSLIIVLFSVVGARGFIGAALSVQLESEGHQVSRLPRAFVPSPNSENLGHLMYCAGVTHNFRNEQFNVVDAHVVLASKILEHCQFDSFTYLSTTRIYESVIEDTGSVKKFALNPAHVSDFYNLSKLMGESLVLNCGIRTARVARISYVVDFSEDSTDEVSSWIRSSKTGIVDIGHHPQTEKDYVCLSDVVNTIGKIAVHGSRNFYNLASGSNTKIGDIGALIESATGCSVMFQSGQTIRTPPQIDISAAAEEFRYQPLSFIERLRVILARSR